MLQFEELRLELNDNKQKLSELREALGLDALKEEIAKLEEQTAAEEFWGDIENSQKVLQRISQLKNKVAKLNNDLREYFDTCGEMSLPNIECTCIGYSPMGLVDTQDIKDEDGNVTGFQATVDDLDYKVEYVEEDGDIYLTGWEELEGDLKYQRRRLNKAWRVFKAENPDAELERDDDED